MADHPRGVWTGGDLADLAVKSSLLTGELGEGSDRSKSTRMGKLTGRFVAERFTLTDRREIVFHRSPGRKGQEYRVQILDEVPNVGPNAERVPNVENAQRSAS